MANIQDVAVAAGVSVATVSRVINNNGKVTAKSVEKVNKAISALKYEPNSVARELRKSVSNRVLVLLQTIANPFYTSVVKGIEDVAQCHNYRIMLCNTDSDIMREKGYLDLLGRKVVNGAIFLDTEMKSKQLNSLAQNNHIVLCCEYRPGSEVSHVMIDNYSAAKTMTRHLISLGYRQIALIVGDIHLSSTTMRYNGYLDALSEANITPDKNLIYKSESSSYKDGIRAAETLYSKKPEAIFAMSDVLAIGAIKSLWGKGLAVPDDIAVAGFDGIDVSSVSIPGLTTILQPTYDMGCMAMKLLINQMKSNIKNNQEVIFEHELLIRESTIKSRTRLPLRQD